METTRHFTATMYVVHDGKTILHHHQGLDLWLPPGGHIARDELPHEAALREVREETGIEAELEASSDGPESETVEPLPMPEEILLEDVNRVAGHVGHQHIDLIYFGTATSPEISVSSETERDADHWEWVSAGTLEQDDRFADDVVSLGTRAIERLSK